MSTTFDLIHQAPYWLIGNSSGQCFWTEKKEYSFWTAIKALVEKGGVFLRYNQAFNYYPTGKKLVNVEQKTYAFGTKQKVYEVNADMLTDEQVSLIDHHSEACWLWNEKLSRYFPLQGDEIVLSEAFLEVALRYHVSGDSETKVVSDFCFIPIIKGQPSNYLQKETLQEAVRYLLEGTCQGFVFEGVNFFDDATFSNDIFVNKYIYPATDGVFKVVNQAIYVPVGTLERWARPHNLDL